jgi:hypothetical protein
MSDNVMYDSPHEFLSEAAASSGEHIAQSVLPREDGSYRCACSCGQWEATASGVEDGLAKAREHTAVT